MSLWKKTMYHLGLGPDDEYDDYDDYDEPEAQARTSRAPRDPDVQHGRGWEREADPTVRTVPQRPSFPSRDFDASSASRRPAQQPSNGRSNDSGVHIRPDSSDS